jgi:hypothetical protein
MNAFWSLSIYADSIMAAVNLPRDFKEFLRLLNFYQTDEIDGVEVCFISLSDLKVNKRAAGRHKDLDDLENLP